MTWGPMFMYYHCPECGQKFKYELARLTEFGDSYGCCPKCRVMGVYEKDGARQPDDDEYPEIDE